MNMIAKFEVTKTDAQNGREQLEMMAVSSKPFDKDGNSEDNSFAKWTPSGSLTMCITNPNLIGTMKKGDRYYLNFSKAD